MDNNPEKDNEKIELQLIEMWKEIFKKEDMSSEDDFFVLGGDSLMAFHIFRKIFSKFGVELPVTVLFDFPTIATLAKFISDNMLQGCVPEKPGLFAGNSFKSWLLSKWRKLKGFRQ